MCPSPEHPDASATAVVERFAREVVARSSIDGSLTLDEILPTVYQEFRDLADALLRRERKDHTLRPTALAHEAYLKLARETESRFGGPAHLLGVAATIMRRVLIDYARARVALRRGGKQERVSLGESLMDTSGLPVDVIELDRALEDLGAEDPRKLRVVELVYFAGFSFEEAAELLSVSTRTLVRDWRFAKAWLYRRLSDGAAGRGGKN